MTKKQTLHPGQILKKKFISTSGRNQHKMSLDMKIPPQRINEIVEGKRGITADTALRFAKYFDTTPEYWLELQMQYNIKVAWKKIGKIVEKEIPSLKKLNNPLFKRPD